MISAAWVRMMVRYSIWQNDAQMTTAKELSAEALTEDRGAFFGSLLGTMNHLLWGDQMWLSRLDGGPAPETLGKDSHIMHPNRASWDADRFRTNGRMRQWAVNLGDLDLRGGLEWVAAMDGQRLKMPIAIAVTHFLNHQTHHRGQIHAMFTAAGAKLPDTDLVLMPDEI